ncbi:MAG: beta-lactamase family protein, partial [Planctomycetes bacterium]|nr:beta-lactamase family protein [Planctomycetota bacterium]
PLFGGTDITLRMLLTHTSGLRDNWGVMPYYPGDPTYPLADYLHDYLVPGGALYDPAKNFGASAPGTAFAYCNNALALAGLVVQHVTGTPFAARCESRLFGPLGMDETAWFLADLDPAHVAMPCAWNGSGWTAYGHFGFADFPSGQLRTSPGQLARFLAMVMAGGQHGGATILAPGSAAALTTPQVPAIDPSQGLVWYSWQLGGRTLWGHNGGDLGVSTEMWFDPGSGIGVVALTNGEAYVGPVVDALFDFAEAYPPATSLVADAAELSAGAGGVLRLTLHGGTMNAGRAYVVLASLSGSQPGTPLPGGLATLALNWDLATEIVVANLGPPMFPGFLGTLGAQGLGRASFYTLGPLPAALVGHALTFAGALMGPWDFATNAVDIAIVP